MKARTSTLALSLLGGSLLAGLPLLGQEDPEPAPQPADPEAAMAQEDRYLLHLATDRPSYRPGEKVLLRGLLLHALTQAPHPNAGQVQLELRSPRGEAIGKGWARAEGPSFGFAWPVPEDAAGGFYTLKAKPQPGYPPAELHFEVRRYRLPRLKTELEFVRKAYGPGEQVEAVLEVERAEGGVPQGASAECLARVDGQVVHRETLRLDAEGRLLVRFQLPASIATPDATLAIVIRDGGVQETASKTIPLILARVRLDLFPEGGDLVAGLPARVYLEARNDSDDPADVRGRVLDKQDREVARFASEHEGRGRFRFTPEAGQRYRLVIDEPAGVRQRYELPPVRAEGVSLEAGAEMVAADGALELNVAATLEGEGRVLVSLREQTIAEAPVAFSPAGTRLELPLPTWAAGALRVTVLDPAGLPRAERLVFRRPAADLQVKVSATPERSVPGGPVTLRIETTNAAGEPVDALVALSVVDDATLKRVEKRERAPRLPVQVLLGNEVRELRDAEVYLDDPELGPLATDLLLGTQGWRRFAFAHQAEFQKAHADAALRVLAGKGPAIPMFPELRRRMRGGVPAPAPGGAVFGAGDEEVDELAANGAPQPKGDAGVPVDVLAENAQLEGGPPADRPAAEPVPEREEAQAEPMAQREADLDDVVAGDVAAEEEPAFAARARQAFADPGPFQWVRQYAHQARPQTGRRTDFAETLLWNPGLRTSQEGVIELSFSLCDSITTFRALVDAVGAQGALSWGEATVEVRRPFYVEPKLPLEVTAGDVLRVPVALVNGGDTPLAAALACELEGTGLALQGELTGLTLAGEERGRTLVELVAQDTRGATGLRLVASASGAQGTHRDDVTRTVSVVPRGFPIAHHWGGQLDAEHPLARTVSIPTELSAGSLEARAVVHPTPLASLADALASLIGEPYGCFEQTSSTNYPNVMAMQYMQSHQGVDPALITRTAGLLDRGYQRLVSFECKEKGYEWFGGDPGHEALTAYGLLEFQDMSGVMHVDPEMVQRTRRWLLSRRDGKGGFLRNSRALDSFGRAPDDVTNAYITWALVEAGETDVVAEAEAVIRGALASSDSYVIGLAANICLGRDDAARAKDLMGKLREAQHADGYVGAAATSITRSGGESLLVETTSLAILAWLREPDFTAATEQAMQWLLERCQGGRFGSTQATVLALRAIVAYDAARAHPKAAGTILIAVDGKVVDEAAFTPEASGSIELPGFADALGPGEHRIELRMVGGSPMPCSLTVGYRADTPATSTATQVKLATRLVDAELNEGEATELEVDLSNATAEGLPMTVAIIGVPGGMEVRTDRLEELKRAGAFDFVETRGREVILYWRALRPREVKTVKLSLVAQVPGSYTAPASRAYLYYTDEHKVWVAGESVSIAATGAEGR